MVVFKVLLQVRNLFFFCGYPPLLCNVNKIVDIYAILYMYYG